MGRRALLRFGLLHRLDGRLHGEDLLEGLYRGEFILEHLGLLLRNLLGAALDGCRVAGIGDTCKYKKHCHWPKFFDKIYHSFFVEKWVLKKILEHLVEELAACKTAILHTDCFYAALGTELTIGQTVYILQEKYLGTLALQVDANDELVATDEGQFILYGYLGYHCIDTALVQTTEVLAKRFEKFVACVLHIVLVIGIVHHALKVALVVAYLHLQTVDIFVLIHMRNTLLDCEDMKTL